MAEIQGKEEQGSLSSDPTDATNLHGPYEQASRFFDVVLYAHLQNG